MSRFEVRVSKDSFVFPAGHFITYDGQCENLHGHNYRASVTVEGDVDENAYVIDFTDVKRIVKQIIAPLDHKMLLPERNAKLQISQGEDEVTVVYKKRRFVFPRGDVVFLPIPNTTAEMIAQYIAGKVKQALSDYRGTRLRAIAVEVEESFGQSAWYREELG